MSHATPVAFGVSPYVTAVWCLHVCVLEAVDTFSVSVQTFFSNVMSSRGASHSPPTLVESRWDPGTLQRVGYGGCSKNVSLGPVWATVSLPITLS